jgi:hypothetical protein
MADRYRDRPFPADEDYGRELSNAVQPQGKSDPLAELARLIGQFEPLPDASRPAHPLRRENHIAYEAAPDDEEPSEPPARPSWLHSLGARQAPPPPREDHYEPRFAEEPPPAPPPGYGYEQPPRFEQAARYDQPAYDPAPVPPAAGDRYDDVLYGRPDHDPRYEAGPYDQPDAGYDAYGAPPPYDDGADHEMQPKRRGGTITVVAVLLLAVVGTGAAFAYRTFIGSPRSGEPPIIKADAGPNKVMPAGAGTDAPGKQIYDRVGEKTAERVVSREEQPVDVRANANAGPRVVFPPLTQNASPPTAASASPAVRPTGAGVGNGTLGGDEPRRIRTLSIRPDQSDAAAAPAAAPAPRAQAPAAPKPAPASTASTGSSHGGPVSLSPQAQQPSEPRARMAAVNPAAGAGGSYVQVSSQKTEADAQASFRALQGKYSGILGSRTALIRRADLGDKGVFYRAMVGPFASTDEATQFCVNLKSAGGQCVVQRN